MKYRSEKILFRTTTGLRHSRRAFSLIEAVTALIILALICSSVLVVIDRCMAAAADSALRLKAFEVARENMETLLAKNSAEEMVEYGTSDKYPGIQWQSVVGTFYEPITSRMWVQAVCSAEYTDIEGEVQSIELTHWLTDLTKKQILEIFEQKKREEQELAERAEDQAEEQGEEEEDQGDEEEKEQDEQEEEDKICGYTLEELLEMDFEQMWQILWNCDEL
jgi:Tfp pilus assembly protein PilV